MKPILSCATRGGTCLTVRISQVDRFPVHNDNTAGKTEQSGGITLPSSYRAGEAAELSSLALY